MKKHIWKTLLVCAIPSVLVISASAQGCALDTSGTLFAEVPDAGPDCQQLCEEAAAGSGQGGTANQPDADVPDATPDVEVPDVCDCGDAGSGGSAGTGGTGGSAGTGGVGGSTGGTGGTGGEAGTAGSGGTGGSTGGAGGTGGEAGTAGTGGAGGSTGGAGGTGGGPITCANAGDSGTVDNVIVSGVTADGVLLHYNQVASEYYSTSHPSQPNFNGEPMPGQLVLAGQDGFSFELRNTNNPVSKPWYKASNFPNNECGGVDGFQHEACLSVVAKSFRCQFAPYLETVDCPAVTVNFASQGSASTHSEAGTGWEIILVDLTCP